MKKNLLYSVIVSVAALLVFSSCKKADPEIRPHIAIQCTYGVSNIAPAAGDNDATIVLLTSDGMAWKLESDVTWVTFEINEGNGSETIACKILANTTETARKAVLTATSDEGVVPPFKYTIEQKKPEPVTPEISE